MAATTGRRPGPLADLTLAELRQRTSKKWSTYPPDVLPLWIADMDVLLADPVAAAIHAAIARGDTGQPTGITCAEAFARFASARWGWDDVGVAWSARVPSVMSGMVEVMKLVTDPGDCAVVNNPVYPPFYAFTRNADRHVLEAALTPSGRLDLEALGGAFEEATSGGRRAAYLLCNPHNPTGTVHTASELGAVAALADRYGVRVIADEVFAPLTLSAAEFVPYLSVAGAGDGFTIASASKGWNLAGLKAATAIPGALARDDLGRLPIEVQQGASHVGLIAQAAAYDHGTPWLDELLQDLTANRQLLGDLLANHLPSVTWHPPAATYVAWLDCGSSLTQGSEPADFFLAAARVALSPGVDFGTGGQGHVRLNFATSPEVLTTAVTQMGRAVDEA